MSENSARDWKTRGGERERESGGFGRSTAVTMGGESYPKGKERKRFEGSQHRNGCCESCNPVLCLFVLLLFVHFEKPKRKKEYCLSLSVCVCVGGKVKDSDTCVCVCD